MSSVIQIIERRNGHYDVKLTHKGKTTVVCENVIYGEAIRQSEQFKRVTVELIGRD